MISITRAAVLAAMALAITPLLVEAHHATAMFDSKDVTMQGVVKEFQYTNPHSWLIVDVTNKDGSVTTWGFEGEGPNALLLKGIHKSDLAPGTKVTVTGHPMKNGQPAALWTNTVRADGVEFDPRRENPAPPPTPAK
jgi:hypothetical protein